jgi:hypothetical protein
LTLSEKVITHEYESDVEAEGDNDSEGNIPDNTVTERKAIPQEYKAETLPWSNGCWAGVLGL